MSNVTDRAVTRKKTGLKIVQKQMKETEKTLSSLDKVQKRRSGGVGRDFLLGLCELLVSSGRLTE